MKDKNVRFIRKGGRVIPIKVKPGDKISKKAKKGLTRKEGGKILRKAAREDVKFAERGRKVAKFSAIGAALSFGAFLFTKGRVKKFAGRAAIGGGLLAGLNKGFAEGRTSSARQAEADAASIEKTGKAGPQRQMMSGAVAARMRQAKMLEKLIKRNNTSGV